MKVLPDARGSEVSDRENNQAAGSEVRMIIGGFDCDEIDEVYLSQPLTGADFIFNRHGSKTVYMRFRCFGRIPMAADYLSFDLGRKLNRAWAFHLARYEHSIGLNRFNGFVEFCLSLLSRGLITVEEHGRLVPDSQGLEECRKIIADRVSGKAVK